jgi:carbon starvation protein
MGERSSDPREISIIDATIDNRILFNALILEHSRSSMTLAPLAAMACALFGIAYVVYGRILSRLFGLDPRRATPAHTHRDGIDFVPAKGPVLLAQHFSAISAAGPIVGPILAGLWFGWLPALLWIVFGSIFLGAVHDYSSIVGSIRHRGSSVAEIVREHVGGRAYKFFLGFVWLSLLYVITAFTDITSASFVEPRFGGGVATASTAYLLIGLGLGWALNKGRVPLWLATLIALPLVGAAIGWGQSFPLRFPDGGWIRPQLAWNFIILGYCFVASLIPVWLLVQPRGYLGGYFLYGTLLAGLVGLFLGGDKIQYPAITGFVGLNGMPLFPMLFVTVACGACSGFHGLVGSGTTSKQIDVETDCRLVGYGGMLFEALVAVVALATLMVLPVGDAALGLGPDRIYAAGLARFVERFGIQPELARNFALLAFATFIYDTLDVTTRLGRYMLQELTGWSGVKGGMAATLLTLTLPAVFVTVRVVDPSGNPVPAWKMFWTIFGTSNQLLAGLTLLGLTTWLKERGGRAWLVTAFPMAFMMVMTLWALGRTILPWVATLGNNPRWETIPVVAVVLFALALLLIFDSVRGLTKKQRIPL